MFYFFFEKKKMKVSKKNEDRKNLKLFDLFFLIFLQGSFSDTTYLVSYKSFEASTLISLVLLLL